MCDEEIGEIEIKQVIESIKKGKAPGSDGLPIEFFLTFWDKLKDIFCACVNETYVKGELPSSTKHAFISLIFKKGNKNLARKL